jgi:hypothetical protein
MANTSKKNHGNLLTQVAVQNANHFQWLNGYKANFGYFI